VIAGEKNYTDVVAIQDWDYDAIKLEMDFAGRRRISAPISARSCA